MRILVTGASGFIGRHVVAAAAGQEHEVIAAVRGGIDGFPPGVRVVERVELADAASLAGAVADAQPHAVIHLAGFANVGWSHREPAAAIAANTAGSAALLTAVAEQAPGARVVLASTSEVYARSPEPLREQDPLAPESPYGQSKRWMEETAELFRQRHGLSIGVMRSFAHAGPGQGPAFALSNFARQVAQAQLAGVRRPTVTTGNKATVRDLSDVRDAADAYLELAASDHPGPLNAGSGVGRSMAEIVAIVGAAAGLEVEHVEDPQLVRPGENPSIVADVSAAADVLGWRPSVAFERTAADAVDWWASALTRDPTHGSGVNG